MFGLFPCIIWQLILIHSFTSFIQRATYCYFYANILLILNFHGYLLIYYAYCTCVILHRHYWVYRSVPVQTIISKTKLFRAKLLLTSNIQEGWLSPTERASVSAISLRHIIWLPQESHAGMSLPSAVCGCRHLATSRESKTHFGLPWIRPWDSRSKCYMDGKRIQCLSNAS